MTATKTALFRHFRSLLAGSLLAQLIYLCTLPILSVLYGPTAFGSFAVLLAAGNILAVIFGLRYDMAIIMPRKVGDALNLLVTVHGLALLIALAVMAVLGLLSGYFSTVHLDNWLSITLLGYLIFSVGAVNYFLHKTEQFWLVSLLAVVKVIAIFVAQVALESSGDGLLLGQLLGSGVLFVFCVAFLVRYCRSKGLRYSFPRSLVLLRQHRRFPAFSFPAALMNVMGSNLPVIIVEALLGKHVAGLFAMANRLVLAPVMLLASTLNNAFIQEVRKRMLSKRPVRHLMQRVALVMVLVGGTVAVAIYLCAELGLISWVLGQAWIEVAEILIWFLPVVVTSMVSTSIARFSVFERHDWGLYFQFFLMCVSTLSIGLASIWADQTSTVFFAYSLSLAGVLMVQVFLSFRLARNNDAGY